jgi:hypothetical protein
MSYFHLGVPDTENATTEVSASAMTEFVEKGTLEDVDDLDCRTLLTALAVRLRI